MAHEITVNDGEPRLIGDRKARKLDREFSEQESAAHGTVRPPENERLTASLYGQRLSRHPHFSIGRIVFSLPYAHWYRVQLDVGNSGISCCALAETGLQSFSVRNTAPLPPMTRVLVMQIDHETGIILGSLPRIMDTGAPNMPDWISQDGAGGIHRERYYRQFPQYFARSGDVTDYSDNRPVDTSCVGEWGRVTDLGGGIHIDPFMSFLRTDEMCGMWQFYLDRLLQLCAYNWDFRSSINEEMIRNDSGEGWSYAGYATYPWEALGVFTPDAGAHRVHSDRDVHFDSPYGKIEPREDDQQPFYRLEEYRGYPGQAYMRHLQLPPPVIALNRYSDQTPGTGVFREQLSLDGSWLVASAHSIHLTKRTLIPVPKRLKPPEDPTGDDAAVEPDYKFSGHYGEGADHKLADGPPEADHPAWGPAALDDTLAYLANWKSLHPFHYHEKDFLTPQQESSESLSAIQVPPDFSALQESQWMPRPDPKELEIDHRYAAKFYELMSAFSMLSDGSVVLRGGAGCELKMAGGSIQLSAPGDIIIQSGRHTIAYAGDDCVIRARNSADITASNKDVRIKAENHLELLAANSGSGRLLLDCRANESTHNVVGLQGEDVEQSGIIVKAEHSELVCMGQDVLVKSLQGQISLDASLNNNMIRFIAGSVTHYVNQSMAIAIPATNPQTLHQFGRSAVSLPTALTVSSNIASLKGGIVAAQNIISVNGRMGSSDGKLGQVSSDSKAKFNSDVSSADNKLSQNREAYGQDFQKFVSQKWWADQRVANADTIANTQYAPRTEAQMNAVDFKLPEVYWQQLVVDSTTIWNEPPINYQGVDMMPHPGLENWSTKQAFLQAELKLYDAETGRDRNRGELYEELEEASFVESVLAENYQVIGES